MRKEFRSQYRLLTSPFRMMPYFFIPGEAKCGTTSLYRYITSHPCILSADIKEPATFIRYGASPLLCRMHYPFALRKVFAAATGKRLLTGEATTSYLTSEDAARHISMLIPDAKLIVMMRNPVTRCFSDYQMMRAGGWEKQDFGEGVSLHLEWIRDARMDPLVYWAKTAGQGFLRYILRGVYVDNIIVWQKYFPKEQFLLLKSEELFDNPRLVAEKAFKFLGVPTVNIGDYPVLKKGTYQTVMSSDTIRQLSGFYRPHNERLYSLIGRDMGWEDESERMAATAAGT